MAMFSSYVKLPDGIIFIYLDGITYVFTYHLSSFVASPKKMERLFHFRGDTLKWMISIGPKQLDWVMFTSNSMEIQIFLGHGRTIQQVAQHLAEVERLKRDGYNQRISTFVRLYKYKP